MSNWTCSLCDETFPASGLSDHFRLFHPDVDAQWETAPVVEQRTFLHDIYKSYVWTLLKNKEWIGVADWLGHALHLPKELRRPLCDAWDRYLGVSDDELERTHPGTDPVEKEEC